MSKNLLRNLCYCLLFCISIGYLLSLKMSSSISFLFNVLIVLFILVLILWLYIYIRIGNFKKKLIMFLRYLLAGNYEVGIKNNFKIKDEITEIIHLTNKIAEQLRIYDELRSEKIGFSYRAIDLIYRSVKEEIIIANLEKKIFQLNPVVQLNFDVKQENITFDSIENQEENKQFMELFKEVVEQEKISKEGNVTLKLPIRESKRDIFVKIVPLKDKEENVKLAIIFITKIS